MTGQSDIQNDDFAVYTKAVAALAETPPTDEGHTAVAAFMVEIRKSGDGRLQHFKMTLAVSASDIGNLVAEYRGLSQTPPDPETLEAKLVQAYLHELPHALDAFAAGGGTGGGKGGRGRKRKARG